MNHDDRLASGARLSWGLLFAALLLPAAIVLRDGHGHGSDTLPDYGVVPSFSLVERSGEPVTRANLAGVPWFADFVYTRCEGSCPVLSAEMARLLTRVGNRARLVSFSVDPTRDTPETLSVYARRFAAPPRDWLFLGGVVAALRTLIADGFHLAVVDAPADAEIGGAITHSEKIVLVDADLHIRRYYDGGGGEWIEQAVRDLEALGGSRAARW